MKYNTCMIKILVCMGAFPLMHLQAAVMIVGEHDPGSTVGSGELETDPFVFDDNPVKTFGNVAGDLADGLTATVIGSSSSDVSTLTDGVTNGSFLFANDSDGRLVFDLGSVQGIAEVNLFTEHVGGTGPASGARGPIRADLWVATGSEGGFNAAPALALDPTTVGWTYLGFGDAETDENNPNPGSGRRGQYGLSFYDTTGTLANARYVLLELPDRQDLNGGNGQLTQEIDIIAVPEPSSLVLIVMGLVALGFYRKRK